MEQLDHSQAFDDYWRFAAKRQAAYIARAQGRPGPWTDDPIIAQYRFTNTFRASDRVSQHLIKQVQYDRTNSVTEEDIIFRTLLFKIFNKITTFEKLEAELGQIRLSNFDYARADHLLSDLIASGKRIYSAAYIMPAPPFAARRKHTNHLKLLKSMVQDRLPQNVLASQSLEEVYKNILSFPGLGPFLAFQYAIDLNYSEVINFDENDFVVAGPGAHDGIKKCFPNAVLKDAEHLIFWMVEHQDQEFSRLGITFDGLFGRKLKAIDCQNIFCEISKYCRIAHPHLKGTTGRTRIKQSFTSMQRATIPKPFFPPKWNLQVNLTRAVINHQQLELYT